MFYSEFFLVNNFNPLNAKFVPSHNGGDTGIRFDSIGIRRGVIFVPETDLTGDETKELTIGGFVEWQRFVRRAIRHPVHAIGFHRFLCLRWQQMAQMLDVAEAIDDFATTLALWRLSLPLSLHLSSSSHSL